MSANWAPSRWRWQEKSTPVSFLSWLHEPILYLQRSSLLGANKGAWWLSYENEFNRNGGGGHDAGLIQWLTSAVQSDPAISLDAFPTDCVIAFLLLGRLYTASEGFSAHSGTQTLWRPVERTGVLALMANHGLRVFSHVGLAARK